MELKSLAVMRVVVTCMTLLAVLGVAKKKYPQVDKAEQAVKDDGSEQAVKVAKAELGEDRNRDNEGKGREFTRWRMALIFVLLLASPRFVLLLLAHEVTAVWDWILGDPQVKKKAESLSYKLRFLQAILLEKKTINQELDAKIREVAVEAEARIESQLRSVYLAAHNSGDPVDGDEAYPGRLLHTLQQVLKDFESLEEWTQNDSEKEMVGREEEYQKIKHMIIAARKERKVIPITGTGGIGKTTLAKRVYQDGDITQKFDDKAWAIVSQEYQFKEVLIRLLHSICCTNPTTTRSYNENCDKLKEELRQRLLGKRYLLVIDDIWSCDAWDEIIRCLPDNINGSRILITTRDNKVAQYAMKSSGCTYIHSPSFLNTQESWNLFTMKVFGEAGLCKPELESIGKSIVKKCQGLPLSIIVIAVLLAAEDNCVSTHWPINSDKIHSILYFGEDVTHATSNETLVLSGLNMLRVLDLSLIKFQYALPGEIEDLVHLRYLALSAGCGSLGNFQLNKLQNLQTLIICSQKKKDCLHLQLPPDILKLPWLQHVCVDKRSSLYLPGLVKKNLQTLIWLNVIGKNPKTTDFKQVPELKELWVYIDNELPPDAFKSLVDLKLLEKLKIEMASVKSFKFPTALPENLKRLTIRSTYLPWKDMDIIGRLKNLEVLKLKFFAFDGPEWELSDAVFPRLKLFVISHSNLECWNADADHFPKLECLILKFCCGLNELPIDFESITTLRLIELHNCYSSLVESAKKFQEGKMSIGGTLVIHDYETKQTSKAVKKKGNEDLNLMRALGFSKTA
nr:putative late blight resistance protein homolog R1B-14 [Ipomoea batatas]